MIPDRRLRPGERPGRAIFLAWLGLSVLLLAVASPYIASGRIPDPDDMLRMVEVRDLIGGQGWYDLHQYRITPPEGVLMHWSRLVDAPIWGLIVLLRPLLGQALAEQVTMIIMPLLVLGLILLAVGRLAWRLFDRETAIFACLAVGLWPVIVMQVQPLRIDHHSWQIFAVAMALWAVSWRSPAKGGAAAGIAMAAGTMISLEILPLATAFAGVLALRWFYDPAQRQWLVSYMQALALGQVAIFALTRGTADLAVHCDVISPPHLGFFVVAALGTSAIAALPQVTRPMTAMLLVATAAFALGYVALTGPQCLGAPFGRLDPLVRSHWYMAVLEGLPIWHQDPAVAVPAAIQVLVALAVTISLAARSTDWLRRWWIEYALLLGAAMLAGALTYRSMAFPAVIGAIPMGWLAARILRIFRDADRLTVKLASVLVLYAIVMPGAFVTIVQKLSQGEERDAPQGLRESSCALQDNAHLLNRLPKGVLFSPLDIGPTVLFETHHSVVASGHHRAEKAMKDVIVAFKGRPAEARPIIERYRADYVVLCTDLHEPANFVAMGGRQSLAARLMAEDPPEWLTRVNLGGPPQFKAWKVERR